MQVRSGHDIKDTFSRYIIEQIIQVNDSSRLSWDLSLIRIYQTNSPK